MSNNVDKLHVRVSCQTICMNREEGQIIAPFPGDLPFSEHNDALLLHVSNKVSEEIYAIY